MPVHNLKALATPDLPGCILLDVNLNCVMGGGARRSHVTLQWGTVQVMAADVHTSPAVATPFPLSLLPVLWLHTPLPILFLYWLGICVAYGGSRGADRKPMPYPDTSTPPE
jgi:hypothetical protein